MLNNKRLSAIYFIAVALLSFSLPTALHAQINGLNAAVLPSSRAVAIGEQATFFAVLANSGTSAVTNCRIALAGTAPAGMSAGFQTTDTNNQLTGTTDTAVGIAAGAAQNYLVRVSSPAAFEGKAPLVFICDEGSAFSFNAVNQPDLRVTSSAGPDIVALGSTISGDGIVNVDLNNRLGAMSIAAINVGAAIAAETPEGLSKPAANEAVITIAGEISAFLLNTGIQIFVCETDAGGVCLAPLALSVDANIGDGGSTFSAFAVKADDPARGVPFIPNYFRLKVTFKDANGKLVGSTSAALNSAAPPNPSDKPVGVWELIMRDLSDPAGAFERRGYLVVPPDGGNVEGIVFREDFSSGTGKLIPVPIRIIGQFDTNTQSLVGTMIFAAKGTLGEASAPIALSYTNGQVMSISYDNTAAAEGPEKGGENGLARPTVNPLTGNGFFSIQYAFSDSNGDDVETVLDSIFGEEKAVQTRAGNTWNLSEDFLNTGIGAIRNIKGKIEGCDMNMDVLKFMGNRQQAVLFGTLTNCPNTGQGEVTDGTYSGPFFFDGIGNGNGDFDRVNAAIFSDGFESGNTSAWSDSFD